MTGRDRERELPERSILTSDEYDEMVAVAERSVCRRVLEILVEEGTMQPHELSSRVEGGEIGSLDVADAIEALVGAALVRRVQGPSGESVRASGIGELVVELGAEAAREELVGRERELEDGE